EPELRALVLTGAGDRAFIGGADIREMSALANPNDGRAFITRLHHCCDAIRAIPVPTIARINGLTLGGGLEIAAACDVRIAAERAVFGMPEVKPGIPSVIDAALLPRPALCTCWSGVDDPARSSCSAKMFPRRRRIRGDWSTRWCAMATWMTRSDDGWTNSPHVRQVPFACKSN